MQDNNLLSDLDRRTFMKATGAMAFTGLASVPAAAETDVVGMIETSTETPVSTKGTTGTGEVSVGIGTKSEEFATRYFEGEGSELSYEIDLESGNDPRIEVQEIHRRDTNFVDYDVHVNGTNVYKRSYQANSAGPNHYFIQIPDEALDDSELTTVTFVNNHSGRLDISQLWAYPDFEGLAKTENIDQPMHISLLLPLQFDDYDSDLEQVLNVKETVSGTDQFPVGFGVQIRYAQWSSEEIERRIDYALDLSAESGLPIHIQFDTWWAGTPNGPDGEGGYWEDLTYQQVPYQPGEGYVLSVPNRWSSVPWLTMNNDRFNEFKRERLEDHLEYLANEYFKRQPDDDDSNPEISGLITDSEPVYWAWGQADQPVNKSGDFNKATVEDASEDGIDLDPSDEDTLSFEERRWLFENLASYNQLIAGAMSTGVGKNPVLVSSEESSTLDRELRDRVFTQALSGSKYPLAATNDGYRFWETSLVNDASHGSEWDGWQTDLRRDLEYQPAWGTTANTNMEKGGDEQFDNVPNSYAHGLDHLFMYNAHPSAYGALQQTLENAGGSYPPITYEDILFSENFLLEEDQFTENYLDHDFSSRAYGAENLKVVDSSGIGPCITPEDTTEPGTVTYRITDDGDTLDNLAVNIRGRAINYFNQSDTDKSITVYGGTKPDDQSEIEQIAAANTSEYSVALDSIANGQTEVYVTFELDADGLRGSLAAWVTISDIEFGIEPEDESGHASSEVTIDQQTARRQSLWTMARQEAREALVEFEQQLEQRDADDPHQQVFESAKDLYDAGRYRSAEALLVEELAQMLPATFVIDDNGQLSEYPVDISLRDTDEPLNVTLTDVVVRGEDSGRHTHRISLDIDTERSGSRTFDVTVLDVNGRRWYDLSQEEGEITIQQSEAESDTAKQAKDGTVTFTVEVDGGDEIPSQLTGSFLAFDEGRDLIEVRPDNRSASSFDRGNRVRVRLGSDAEIKRRQTGEDAVLVDPADLELRDQLTIPVRENSVSSSVANWEADHVEAVYGVQKFEIDEFKPLNPDPDIFEMAKVTDADGNTFTFDVLSQVDLQSQSGSFKNVPPGELDLQAGDVVRVRYNPIDRRITEIKDSVVLFSEDYESEDWEQPAESYENVMVGPLDGNHPQRGLMANDLSEPGSITYRVTSEQDQFHGLALSYKGRSIIADGNRITFYAGGSVDNLQQVDELTPDDSESGNFRKLRSIDLSEFANGRDELYVRIEIVSSSFNSWSYLGSVSVKGEFGI